MNLADPELEFIDPTPNVHSLFVHFDTTFFWNTLAGKAVVRWSKRMYSCAGICCYEGKGGICDIALSEPLLKLRPRKDLVETLLHEMIHAYLFIVGKDQSRNGHGPNFLLHMNRINHIAGVNITVYHDFHDEVKLYQNHVWRCNGPCQKVRPYFGVVRRSNNRAPGPSDFWWKTHKRVCGGTFAKCQEPQKPAKQVKQPKKTVSKSNGDITKYINNNNETITNNNETIRNKNDASVRKSINGFNDLNSDKSSKPAVFTGPGKALGKPITNAASVTETVRSIWANKTLPVASNVTKKPISKSKVRDNKRTSNVANTDSLTPPKKIKKIDDYFKTTASNILKDVYGKDFKVTQTNDTDKFKAVVVKETLVECPICKANVNDATINAHIDECLSKDVVNMLSKEVIVLEPNTSQIKQESKNINLTTRKINVNSITIKPEIKIENEVYTKVKTEPTEFVDLTYQQIKKDQANINSTRKDFTNQRTSKGIISHKGSIDNKQIKKEPTNINNKNVVDNTNQPGTSKTNRDANENVENTETGKPTCPCCDKILDKPIQEHLDECLIFFDDDASVIDEGSFVDRTIVIDDSDDEFDETQTFNATGTKSPCPCCMKMVEESEMNQHLDMCLGLRD